MCDPVTGTDPARFFLAAYTPKLKKVLGFGSRGRNGSRGPRRRRRLKSRQDLGGEVGRALWGTWGPMTTTPIQEGVPLIGSSHLSPWRKMGPDRPSPDSGKLEIRSFNV